MLFLCVAAQAYLPANGGVSSPVHYLDFDNMGQHFSIHILHVRHLWGTTFYAFLVLGRFWGSSPYSFLRVLWPPGQDPLCIFACAGAPGTAACIMFVCVEVIKGASSILFVCCVRRAPGSATSMHSLRGWSPWGSSFCASVACVESLGSSFCPVFCVRVAPVAGASMLFAFAETLGQHLPDCGQPPDTTRCQHYPDIIHSFRNSLLTSD